MSNIKLAIWKNDNTSHIPQVNIVLYVGQKIYYRISTDPESVKSLTTKPQPAPAPESTEAVFTFGGRTPPANPATETPKRVDYIHGDHTLIIENFLDGTTETITINIPNKLSDNPETSATEARLDDLEDLFANLVMPRGFGFGPFMMGSGRGGPSNELMYRMEKIWSRTRNHQSDTATLYYEVIDHPDISVKMNAAEQQLLTLIKTDPVFQFSFIADTRGCGEAAEAVMELVPDLVYKPEIIDALIDRSSDYFYTIIQKYGAPTDRLKEMLFEYVRNLYYPNDMAKVMVKVFPEGVPQKYQTKIIETFSKTDAVRIIPNLTEESQFLILGEKHSNIKHIAKPTKAVLAKTKRLKNEYLLSQLEADA